MSAVIILFLFMVVSLIFALTMSDPDILDKIDKRKDKNDNNNNTEDN